MRILLVDPPFNAFMHYDKWYFPSSLAQLAAVAHKYGHETFIYDADRYFYKDVRTKNRKTLIGNQNFYFDNVDNCDHYIWKHYLKILEDFRPDVVGCTIYTCKLKSCLNLLKWTKKFNPKIKTCVGGAHATALPETLIKEEYIDNVFIGHSETTFPSWINDGMKYEGIIHGDPHKIDFENLPYVRRQSLLFIEKYTKRDLGLMITSRGCIGKCRFCSNPFMWKGQPLFRTSESVRNELLELIEKWKIKELLLADPSMSCIHKESKRISEIIKEFNIPWSANVRWATFKPELIEHFMNCGCKTVKVGLESGSDKMLRYTKKGCTKDIIRDKAKILNSLGISWHLFSIIGFPTETEKDMFETMELALEIKPTSISLNSFSPLPGTYFYNLLDDITPEFASDVNQLNPIHSFSEQIDAKTFSEIFIKISETFHQYNSKKN